MNAPINADELRLVPEMASFRLLVYAFVRDYMAQHGASPSYGEIAARLRSNRKRVMKAIRWLVREGLLLRVPGPRGIRLPSMQDEAIRQLRGLGWVVDEDAMIAGPPAGLPVTKRTLLTTPALDYHPERGTEGGEPVAKARAARNSERDRQYAELHPARAREERALRKANLQLHEDWGHKVNGTPETHAKARLDDGALARLCSSGSIDGHQLAASQEIRWVAERLGRDAGIGTVSFETRVDQSRSSDGAFFEKLGAVRAEIAYTGWRAALRSPTLVLAMIVEDLGCNDAARRFRKDKRTVRRLLIEALDAWPLWYRDACDQVDEATLLAAQAAIL